MTSLCLIIRFSHLILIRMHLLFFGIHVCACVRTYHMLSYSINDILSELELNYKLGLRSTVSATCVISGRARFN
jgi:hypothetical protein